MSSLSLSSLFVRYGCMHARAPTTAARASGGGSLARRLPCARARGRQGVHDKIGALAGESREARNAAFLEEARRSVATGVALGTCARARARASTEVERHVPEKCPTSGPGAISLATSDPQTRAETGPKNWPRDRPKVLPESPPGYSRNTCENYRTSFWALGGFVGTVLDSFWVFFRRPRS